MCIRAIRIRPIIQYHLIHLIPEKIISTAYRVSSNRCTKTIFIVRLVDEYRQVEEELDEVIELLHRKYGFIDFNVGRNGEFDDLATQAVRRFRREWEEWCELTLVEPYPVANLDIIEKSYDTL